MKRFLSIILLSVLLFSLSVFTVLAETNVSRVSDGANYLEGNEEAELEKALNDICRRYGIDVVIVTVERLNGKDITANADDFYDGHGYREDGILLLVADYEREWAISTSGYCISAFTNAGQEYISDRFVGYLSDGEYYRAFLTFAELCDDFIAKAKDGEPYDYGNLPKEPFNVVLSLIVSIGIGLVSALIVTGVMKAKLKTVRPKAAATEYIRSGSVDITESREIFLYRNISRVRRVKKSGGSSTHRSSSGRRHGGSRGRF